MDRTTAQDPGGEALSSTPRRLLPSLVYVASVALSSTLIALYSGRTATATMLLTSTVAAMLVYHGVNIRRLAAIYRQAAVEWRSVAALNLAVLIAWAAAYRGYEVIGAAGFMYLYCLSIAVASAVGGLVRGQNKGRGAARLCVGSILLAAYMLVAEGEEGGRLIEGYALALVGGGSTFVYFVVSEALHARAGMSPVGVLTVRFYALLGYAALVSAPWGEFVRLPPSDVAVMIGIGLLTFVVPIYAAQIGIQRIGAERHAVIVATTPFFTFLVEGVVLGAWSFGLFALSALGGCYLLLRRG